MSGQIARRAERMQKTVYWLQAIPVDSSQLASTDQDEVDPGYVQHEVEAIRVGLASGVDHIEYFVSRPQVVEAITNQLTDEELSRVSFPGTEAQTADT